MVMLGVLDTSCYSVNLGKTSLKKISKKSAKKINFQKNFLTTGGSGTRIDTTSHHFVCVVNLQN